MVGKIWRGRNYLWRIVSGTKNSVAWGHRTTNVARILMVVDFREALVVVGINLQHMTYVVGDSRRVFLCVCVLIIR